jgi:hypothetical protein
MEVILPASTRRPSLVTGCHGGFGSRGDRGGERGRGRGGRRGRRGPKQEEKEWQPVTKLGRLVKAGKITSMEQIYLHSLPVNTVAARTETTTSTGSSVSHLDVVMGSDGEGCRD